jgi:DNA replication factor GINS
LRKIDDNPFSFESYLLRDAQRIVAEICERREHKIANSAVMNVQRAYQLFKESKSKDSKDDNQITVPINSTPEEEFLYLELVDSIVKYRGKLTAPLMSYIQKNQGNHTKTPLKENLKLEKPLKSIDIDELLSAAQEEPIIEEGHEDQNSHKGDFENQIFERFGSEPSRKEESKKGNKESSEDKADLEDKNISENESDTEKSVQSNNVSKSDLKTQKTPIKTLMILDELPSIIGVDKNIYGPISPQDLITIPEPNAKILVKNKKGIFIQTYK